ncbi:TDP-N-acetylfucosamine:lipid II N-acetylfucosaminyltransferase [Saccharospirillum sp.]|uniref:TDP-N-acetylfucosamine:lipid II N-acetylfucosaminyltransferase n=1 Tax=Saccharospirillum sp. TaxID=2033801 RepID=UPI0034A01F51
MILHVGTLDKFIPPFVKLVNEQFKEEEHRFWFTGSIKQYTVEQSNTVYVCTNGVWSKLLGHARLVRQFHAADKIILHGLFNIDVVLLLALCPWVLPKCHWLIWGGDLYQYTKTSGTVRSRIKEVLRRFVIHRIGHLVTYIEGDVELARQWYGAKGSHHECIMYLSNVVNPGMVPEASPQPDKAGLNILLGNSADPSNNHVETLERLRPYKDQDILIYAPLSYGDQDYAKQVIDQGKEWFGDKFVPMTDFMPFDQYLEFLKSLDIAVFNHQRQQAMGNTILLLGMGKTVFMRSDVTHWRFLSGLGVKLFDVSQVTLQLLSSDEMQKNAHIVHSYFSRATLIKQLSDIFEA